MPRLPNLKKWAILVAVYACWNLNAYMAKELYGGSIKWYDYSYWLWERVFVITALWAILPIVQTAYKWVLKTMICVAIWKFLYIAAVVTDIIKPNRMASLMGLLFTVVLSIMVLKWEKLHQTSGIR